MRKIRQFLRNCYVPLIEKIRFLKLRIQNPIHILSCEKTIEKILAHEYSIARFGDGELNITLHDYGVVFQGYSVALSLRLREVMGENDSRLLLCMPRALSNQRGLNKHAKTFWRSWALNNYNDLTQILNEAHGRMAVYGDANITRPYKDWQHIRHAKRVFPMLKRLWDSRDILIVEGEQTRLGVGNDLLDNAKSIRRILCPPKNAFDSYDAILQAVLAHRRPNELVLLALGPTATVLAVDLAKRDIQALDVGHMDIEYEWMLCRSVNKEQIPGKYTNEANSTEEVSACTDPDYLSQILDRVV